MDPMVQALRQEIDVLYSRLLALLTPVQQENAKRIVRALGPDHIAVKAASVAENQLQAYIGLLEAEASANAVKLAAEEAEKRFEVFRTKDTEARAARAIKEANDRATQAMADLADLKLQLEQLKLQLVQMPLLLKSLKLLEDHGGRMEARTSVAEAHALRMERAVDALFQECGVRVKAFRRVRQLVRDLVYNANNCVPRDTADNIVSLLNIKEFADCFSDIFKSFGAVTGINTDAIIGQLQTILNE